MYAGLTRAFDFSRRLILGHLTPRAKLHAQPFEGIDTSLPGRFHQGTDSCHCYRCERRHRHFPGTPVALSVGVMILVAKKPSTRLISVP